MFDLGSERPCCAARAAAPVRRFVYRSRATARLTPTEIGRLVEQGRARNLAANIDGVLVQDGSRFLQVLEGRPDDIGNLERSLRRDPRHGDFDVLSDQSSSGRVFADTHLALIAPVSSRAAPKDPIYDALHAVPERLPTMLAELGYRFSPAPPADWAPEADSALHAEAVLRFVLESHGLPDPRRFDAVLHEFAPTLRRFVGLLEDTSVALGRMWMRDLCSGASVSMVLAAMQGAIRRRCPIRTPSKEPRGRVVIATLPGEPHILGALLKAEMLRAAGWEVAPCYSFAGDSFASCLSVAPTDALILVGSRVFSRAPRHDHIAQTVRAARQLAGPRLQVVAGGGAASGARRVGPHGVFDAVCPSAAMIDRLLEPSFGRVVAIA